MTSDINPDGYAVVYYDGDVPRICRGMGHGMVIDGQTYAIYGTAEDAATEFVTWPTSVDGANYGIIPVRLLCEERPRYVLTEAALQKV